MSTQKSQQGYRAMGQTSSHVMPRTIAPSQDQTAVSLRTIMRRFIQRDGRLISQPFPLSVSLLRSRCCLTRSCAAYNRSLLSSANFYSPRRRMHAAMACAAGDHQKWSEMYARHFTPWNSRKASSQLVWYMESCLSDARPPSCPGPRDFTQHPQAQASGLYHVCSRCAYCKPGNGTPTALEIGCGTGNACAYMARLGFHVVGVDLTSPAVDAARQEAEREGVSDRCIFLQADFFAIPRNFSYDMAEASLKATPAHDVATTAGDRVHEEHSANQPSEPRPHVSEHVNEAQRPPCVDPAASAISSEASAAECSGAPGFDFIYDCQTFHVLRNIDQDLTVQMLYDLLRPGGFLFLLTGNAAEPFVGPNILSESDFHQAFPESKFEVMWMSESRFDATEHYVDVLQKRPLAWWVLLRKLG